MEKDNASSQDLQPWHRLESTELYASRWLKLRQDKCRLPSGRELDDYLVVEMPAGAAIVAITERNELILVRQYKHGLGQLVLELPAGIVDPEEDPAHTIARELLEETGYIAPSVEYVATLASKPGRMSARTFVYFTSNVVQKGEKQDNDSEVIQTVLVPLSELNELIQRGDIVTETSLAALLMVWHRIQV